MGAAQGIGVVGTGDLTHPAWLAELDEKLEPLATASSACAKRSRPARSRFLPVRRRLSLSGEISCIYRKNGRTRKVHALVLMPDRPSVDRPERRAREDRQPSIRRQAHSRP